jgi:hypothetical protein
MRITEPPARFRRVPRRYRVRMLVLVCAIAFGSCILAPPAESSSAEAISVLLSVAPVPTSSNPAPGTPLLTWSTGNRSPGEVTVSFNGGKELLVASGSEGSQIAPWISSKQASGYVFRLYARGTERRLLARLRVGRPAATIVSLPRSPPFTSPLFNRLLQVSSIGGVILVMTLAVLYIRETFGGTRQRG